MTLPKNKMEELRIFRLFDLILILPSIHKLKQDNERYG